MRIQVDWDYADENDEALDYCRALYTYLHPKTQEILYIGKSDQCSVRERLKGEHKRQLFTFFSRELGLKAMSLQVGELLLPENSRYSSALPADVESLLISCIRPCGNIQSISTRISRPGMVVSCIGEWQHEASTFFDTEA